MTIVSIVLLYCVVRLETHAVIQELNLGFCRKSLILSIFYSYSVYL